MLERTGEIRCFPPMTRRTLFLLLLALATTTFAQESSVLPPELSDYQLTPAPSPSVSLKKGDRLAICGDSITEQKMYSVLIETYLTACLPELGVTCRQYGWSGEQAGGFRARMDNDVLRFNPTVATSCYGMNDFHYVPFDEAIAAEYRKNQTEIARKFKQAGARYVIGSAGIIDSVPHWVKTAAGTKKDLNLSLSKFRNIALKVAVAENVGFADVYRPMLVTDFNAKKPSAKPSRSAARTASIPVGPATRSWPTLSSRHWESMATSARLSSPTPTAPPQLPAAMKSFPPRTARSPS